MPRLRRTEEEQRRASEFGPDYLEILARGLKVIGAFDASRRALTLSEIATILDASRASVRRALYTLEMLGYVVSDGRLFRLTPRVLMLAKAYLSSSTMTMVMAPLVERVALDVHESCAAAVLDGDDVVFVASATPARVITVRVDIGLRLPAFCTSVGRVMLAHLSDTDLDAYLGRLHPTKLTERTVIDKVELRAAIISARTKGYALVDGEGEFGLRSIAVPVKRVDGTVVCALNIGVRSERVAVKRLESEFLAALRSAACEAEQVLI